MTHLLDFLDLIRINFDWVYTVCSELSKIYLNHLMEPISAYNDQISWISGFKNIHGRLQWI
jgi:hypothetical protein